MPPAALTKRRLVCLLLATLLLLRTPVSTAQAGTYAEALRLRATLDATPRARRTPRQYQAVLHAFRAVYHADRAAPDADSSVEAVAEILAEEGRAAGNAALLRSAVEQLEFLRRDFAASRYSVPALLTQGEIEARDLHEEPEARALFLRFLEDYPHSPLAPQARAELRRLGGVAPPVAVARAPEGQQPSASADDYPVGSSEGEESAAVRPPRRATPTQRTQAVQPSQTASQKPPENPVPVGSASLSPASPSLVERDVPAAATRGAGSAGTPSSIVGGVPVYRAAGTQPPARPGRLAPVTGIRHWSTASYTRVAVDLGDEVPFEASRVSGPDRIFFDLHGAKLAPQLAGKAVTVTDGGFLQRIRAAQFSGDVVRVVLDVTDVSDYSAFWLPNPSRLIIDIHGRPKGAAGSVLANAAPPASQSAGQRVAGPPATATVQPAAPPATHAPPAAASAPGIAAQRASAAGSPTPRAAGAAAPGTFVAETTLPGSSNPAAPTAGGDSMASIAALSRQPSRVRATRNPTTAPVAEVSGPAPAETTDEGPTAPAGSARRKGRRSPASAAPVESPGVQARAAEPDATGGRSMVRALGLKINRIVVDAGHGGHDSGTLGPGGLEEKDVVLDVALRLGKLLKQRLGADVIYTRDDDTFIPLETRTAIANKAQADLFISVHANSSPDASARGVETYYLNFTNSADALEVAARENAVSDESIHQLSDLVKKITLQDKIAESKEFASDVEGSLYAGLEAGNSGLKDRGVKKAPFVVLIGANMPSILAEISFLTNPDDASELRDEAYRQRIAESLYRGVAKYVRSLSGSRLEESAGSD